MKETKYFRLFYSEKQAKMRDSINNTKNDLREYNESNRRNVLNSIIPRYKGVRYTEKVVNSTLDECVYTSNWNDYKVVWEGTIEEFDNAVNKGDITYR